MKAIVLAAGMGNRLRGVFDDPKCLMSVGGICLLERYLESFYTIGIKEAILVLGYRMEKIIKHIQKLPRLPRIHITKNMDYDKGSILSLFAARNWLCDDVLLMDADMYFEKGFLVKALESKQDNFFQSDS